MPPSPRAMGELGIKLTPEEIDSLMRFVDRRRGEAAAHAVWTWSPAGWVHVLLDEMRRKAKTAGDDGEERTGDGDGKEAGKMAKRKVYHVSKREDGQWGVVGRGAKRAAAVERTKEEAKRRATEIARGQEPSQVVIHKEDGRIQEERTYGGDPRRRKG